MNFFQMLVNETIKILEIPAQNELKEIVTELVANRTDNVATLVALVNKGGQTAAQAVVDFVLQQVSARPALGALLKLNPSVISAVTASVSSLIPANTQDSIDAFIAKQYDYLVAFLQGEIAKL